MALVRMAFCTSVREAGGSKGLNSYVRTPSDVMDQSLFTDEAVHCVVYDDEHFYRGSVVAEKFVSVAYRVTHVTPLTSVYTWTDFTLEQGRIVDRFNELDIDIQVNACLESGGGFRSTSTGKLVMIEYNSLVLVGARLLDDQLYKAAVADARLNNIYQTGDCLVLGTIQAAVLAGHTLARRLIGGGVQVDSLKRSRLKWSVTRSL